MLFLAGTISEKWWNKQTIQNMMISLSNMRTYSNMIFTTEVKQQYHNIK